MQYITGRVVRGHQVASGLAQQDRFPGGTIAMQLPFFRQLGLQLDTWHQATLNVAISPLRFEILRPAYLFRQVKWHPVEPAEDFSFFDCEIEEPTPKQWVPALVYYPHPETKPAHLQPPDVLEVMAQRKLADLNYGKELVLRFGEGQIHFFRP